MVASRRNFIRSAVSTTIIGYIGTAMGATEEIGTNEIGITDEVGSLIANGKDQDVRSLLEEIIFHMMLAKKQWSEIMKYPHNGITVSLGQGSVVSL